MRKDIEYAYYPSEHIVYAHRESLQRLHEKVADVIRRASAAPP